VAESTFHPAATETRNRASSSFSTRADAVHSSTALAAPAGLAEKTVTIASANKVHFPLATQTISVDTLISGYFLWEAS